MNIKQVMKRPYLLLILLTTLLFSSCRQETEQFVTFGGFVQGTTYSIIYQDVIAIDDSAVHGRIDQILHDFDLSLSLFIDSSLINRVNRNEHDVPDPYFESVFRTAQKVWQISDGFFDPTVSPLINAWGFGVEATTTFSDDHLDSLMELVGMNKIDIRNGRVVKSDPRIALNFDAIAQGYSVDIVSYYLESLGVDNYLVEIGGEVRAGGSKNGKPWRIGIDKPVDGNLSPGEQLQAVISLENKSLATSGNYRKYYIEDGVKYSHTINPKTGYPTRDPLLSATILCDNCIEADAVATACMAKGKDLSISFLQEHPEYEGFLIFSDDSGEFDVWLTDGMEEKISQY